MSEQELMERGERRLLRGSILRAVNTNYSTNAVLERSIEFIVQGRGASPAERQALQEEIRFLCDKGYLAKEIRRRDVGDENPATFYSLTVAGRLVVRKERLDEDIVL